MEKIKVCCVVSTDITLKFMLFNQLKFLQQEGYEVHAVSSAGKWVNDIEVEGIKVERIRFKRKFISPFSDIAAFVKLFFYFRREQFAIVHTHTLKPEFYGQIAAKLAGVPVILNTIHGLDFGDKTPQFEKNLIIILQRIAALASTTVFSISKNVIDEAVKEAICPREKLAYLGRDIDMDRFNPHRFSAEFILKKKKELGIDPSRKVIGIVARLVREKGYLEVFKAMKGIVQKIPETLLIVIGQDEPEKRDAITKDIVQEYGIENQVNFLGERTDMEELYAMMDLFILPSHREGIGASILEASAMEKPVVATNIPGCAEAVEHGRTGTLIPLGDAKALEIAIIDILQNPGKALEMGKQGRQKIEREFKKELVLGRLGTFYKRLLQKQPCNQ